MRNWIIAAAAGVAIAAASPVAAQQTPLAPGEYWEVASIKVDDGKGLDYARWLATEWKRFNDYSKSQGWISDYKILYNVHNRSDEGDVYLITKFKSLPDAAESERRDAAFRAAMRRSEQQLAAESGQRAQFRHVMGSMLFREMHPRQ